MTELQTGGRQADAAATYKIASIPADGVGKEVVAAGRKVLDFVAEQSNGAFAFEWDEFDWGSEYYARTGRMMAEDGLETLKDFDAIYFGAVGWANVPDHISLWGLRLNITQNFDQWANVRPVKFHPGVVSPRCARPTTPTSTGSSSGRTAKASTPASAAATCPAAARATRSPCRPRCSPRRAASGSCGSRSTWPAPARVKKVSSVTKSNAQQYGMVLWDETFTRVAADYPDVATESVLVDAMSAKFVLTPEDLSVVVASNLNADILSDLGSALAGSLGLAASANLQPGAPLPEHVRAGPRLRARTSPAAGVSNPIGTIASGALMLDHFGLHAEARARAKAAIDAVTGSGHADPRHRRHRRHRRGHHRDHRGAEDRAGPRLTAVLPPPTPGQPSAHRNVPAAVSRWSRRRHRPGSINPRNYRTSIDPGRVLWVFRTEHGPGPSDLAVAAKLNAHFRQRGGNNGNLPGGRQRNRAGQETEVVPATVFLGDRRDRRRRSGRLALARRSAPRWNRSARRSSPRCGC